MSDRTNLRRCPGGMQALLKEWTVLGDDGVLMAYTLTVNGQECAARSLPVPPTRSARSSGTLPQDAHPYASAARLRWSDVRDSSPGGKVFLRSA